MVAYALMREVAMGWMKALVLLVGTWVLLAGADCNNPASDSNGGMGGTSGTAGTGGISTADFEGDWLGPAKFLDCEYSDLDTPAPTEGPAFGEVMVRIDSSGDVTQILIDGEPLRSPDNTIIDLGSVTSTEFLPKNFLKLVFGDSKPFPIDPVLGYANIESLDPIKRYVDDGGLIFEDPTPTANNGPPKSQHAFFFLHDIGGCDIAVGVLQLNAPEVPSYQDTDVIGVWSGFGEAFFTDSPGVEDDGWQGNIIQTVSVFESSESCTTPCPWKLEMVAGISVTGEGQDFMGLAPTFTPFVDVSFTGGDIALNGWFEGTTTTSESSTWWVEGFLSPDGKFFAGFTWPEDQNYEAGFRWQDLILTRTGTD